jgi:hypothetical protein
MIPTNLDKVYWVIDQAYQDRPGNKEIQLSLFTAHRFGDWTSSGT